MNLSELRGGRVASILGRKMSENLESRYKPTMSLSIINLTKNVILNSKPKYIYRCFFKSTEKEKEFLQVTVAEDRSNFCRIQDNFQIS